MKVYTIENMNESNKISRKLKEKLKNNDFSKIIELQSNRNDLNSKIGQWYWSGYLEMAYRVLDKKFMIYKGKKRFKNVTVMWEDGKKTTHCTSLDPRYDFKLYR